MDIYKDILFALWLQIEQSHFGAQFGAPLLHAWQYQNFVESGWVEYGTETPLVVWDNSPNESRRCVRLTPVGLSVIQEQIAAYKQSQKRGRRWKRWITTIR